MSVIIPRLAAGFAASALLLSSGPAAAAGGGTGGGTTDPCVSYTLTLQGCQSPVHMCELAAREKAKTDPNATCNTLIRNATEDFVATLPQRTVVVPTLKDSSGTAVPPSSATQVVGIQTDAVDNRTMLGLNSQYLGTVHRAQTYIPASGWYSDYLETQRQQQRDAWHASGYVVDSCSEYVFEKYYDYSVFEDAIVASGTNYRAIFNVAYASGRVGPPASAIGSNGIIDPVLRGKNGAPISPAIAFDSSLPKNEFFTVPLPVSSKVSIVKGAEDKVYILPAGGGVMIQLKNLQRTGLNLTGVVFDDSSLNSTINAGASYYAESWSWHKTMSQRNASLLDEQMYELERLQDDFNALLNKRSQMAATIASMLQSTPVPSVGGSIFYDGYWRDPLWNPDPTRIAGFAQVDVNVLDGVVQPVAPAPTPSLTSKDSSFALLSGGGNTGSSSMPGYADALSSTTVLQACAGNQLICLLYKLAALDNAIEQALVNAQQKGCLTFNTSGPVACDWSPKRFSKRVLGLYQTQREQAYTKCMDYTDNDFASLKSKALVVAGKVNYPATNYTTSPAQLELYFTRKNVYLAALSSLLNVMRDPSTGAVNAVWSKSDTYSMGDETFGASASYEVSAKLQNLSKTCAPSPEFRGKLVASGSALGNNVQLIYANAVLTQKRADIDLDVMDNSIHVLDVHQDLTAGEYNIVSGSKSKSTTFLDVSTTFTIGPVPVSVGAKLGGTLGFNYSVDATYTASSQSGCTVNTFGLSGLLEPYASVDGELYVAVELVIAQIGVKGRVQLVHAGVPINGQLNLAYGINGSSQLTLQLQAKADLRFVFLSGNIDVYVKLGICPLCEEFSETLVSWDGLSYDINLFEKSATFPLVDLQQAL